MINWRFERMKARGNEELARRFVDLVALMARLRAPGGCPWDREQTHRSIKPMTIEEAYEVAEAIDEGTDEELMGELGDLLLQVVFHGQIAAEDGRFDLCDIIDVLSEKLIRRHPHVFAAEELSSSAEVLRHWEAVKLKERQQQGKAERRGSLLDSVSRSHPSLMEAYQLTTKASRVGFDWPDHAGALEKLEEELGELKRELGGGAPEAVERELGDLLFAAVNVARLLGVDPESALKASNRKFRRRFLHIEERLRESDRRPADSDLAEMDALWNEAKRLERCPTTT
jgi:tetrapyrrole methylase family protein / MazG family protein